MKILLDANIIIHSESESVKHLYYWLNQLNCEILVHKLSIEEINNNNDEILKSMLLNFNELKTITEQTEEFISKLENTLETENDAIDNQLLCELFNHNADIFITEDRKIRPKAIALGISPKVYSINSFLESMTYQHPNLITYKALSVIKEKFVNIDIKNSFFNTFKSDYMGFEEWFDKKGSEEAYICKADNDKIQGFLYLKVENENEQYIDISPQFTPKKRLKVGTFKVEATGFRLGERFLKIIFDNAIANKVDEIYVTLFTNREELKGLADLLQRWGFFTFGEKNSNGKVETVLVKKMNEYDQSRSEKYNFPNINYNNNKYILPILAKYHTRLIPDSILNTEKPFNFLEQTAEKYSLEKAYLSLTFKRDASKGDIVTIYRMGETEPKGYSSVVSTLAVISEIQYGFKNKEEFLGKCENRTVFTINELEDFWSKKGNKWVLVKFIPICSLNTRPTLNQLRDKGIIPDNKGPRPFHFLNEIEFNDIIEMSKTELYKGE